MGRTGVAKSCEQECAQLVLQLWEHDSACIFIADLNLSFHTYNATAMHKACRAAARELRRGRPAADAVVAAIAVLEDNPACNAGRGSNLTMQGTVECDASLMTDVGAFGGVGAVPGLAHPVKAAARLAAESLEKQPCGLVPPL